MTKIKLKMPEIKFARTEDLQANYICFLASQIAEGVYQKHGYVVLPYLTPYPKTVYFPNLPYSSKFWRIIKKSPNKSVARLFPSKARDEIRLLLSNIPQMSLPLDWERKRRLLFKTLAYMGLFISEIPRISSITILLTPFGTAGSFHHIIKKSGKIDVFITHRPSNPSHLAQTIILALLLIQNQQYADEKWQDKQIIADYLLSSTILSKLFPDFRLSYYKEKLPVKFLLDGKNFLNKLGFGYFRKLKVVDSHIFWGEKKIDKILSPQEKVVLTTLILRNREVVSHDEIAKALWGEKAEEKFSLWAITKLAQKIRVKLKSLGINNNLVYTVYGKGYGC